MRNILETLFGRPKLAPVVPLRCGSCKHFHPNKTGASLGVCTAITSIAPEPAPGRAAIDEMPTINGSGFCSPVLCVHVDFGCVLYREGKSDATG